MQHVRQVLVQRLVIVFAVFVRLPKPAILSYEQEKQGEISIALLPGAFLLPLDRSAAGGAR